MENCPSNPGQKVRRMVSCRTRGELAELCVVAMPVLPEGSTVPGMLNTLFRKSTFTRSCVRSVNFTVLYAEAAMFHSIGPSTNCCCNGSTYPPRLVRCTVPSFKGTHTVLVS